MAELFSDEWAQAAKDAINAEPDPEYKADKLELYWMWILVAMEGLDITWALGIRDLGKWLVLDIENGQVTSARTADQMPDDVTYALAGDLADWRDIMEGFNANKAVMYRRLQLERGDVFAFFDRIYFFIEALVSIQGIPTELPEPVGV